MLHATNFSMLIKAEYVDRYYSIRDRILQKLLLGFFIFLIKPFTLWFFFILTLYVLFTLFTFPDPYNLFLHNLDSRFEVALNHPSSNVLLIHVRDYDYSSDFPNQELWDDFREKNKHRSVGATLALVRPFDDSYNSPEDPTERARIESYQPLIRFKPYTIFIFKSEHISSINVTDNDIRRNLAALRSEPNHGGLQNVECVYVFLNESFFGPHFSEFTQGLELARSRAHSLHGSSDETPLTNPVLKIRFFSDKDTRSKYLS